MEEINEVEKVEDMILPGFRFHPTDEELVGFYLKRKVHQKPLSIELIRQLNIYKYDPWDLPKLATSGEKEWYFYCPRDRKYRNSARPNRVTGAGFWKATGTDRPIYSSEGTKCIGLKKSLVFYQGRAAKGVKTDWMMHEFRLPSVTDASLSKRPIEKNIPVNDSWAICRIFKKTSSMAQRVLSRSWPSPPQEPSTGSADLFSVSCNTGAAGSTIEFAGNNSAQHPHSLPTTHYPTPVAITTNKPNNLTINSPKTSPLVIPTSFVFPGAGDASTPSAASKPTCTSSVDVAAMLLSRLPPAVLFEDASMVDFGHRQQQQLQPCFTIDLPEETSGGDLSVLGREIMCMRKKNNTGGDGATSSRQCSNNGTRPASLCPGASHGWRPNSTAPWDSPPCPPSEVSLINLAAELD